MKHSRTIEEQEQAVLSSAKQGVTYELGMWRSVSASLTNVELAEYEEQFGEYHTRAYKTAKTNAEVLADYAARGIKVIVTNNVNGR